MAGYHYAIEKQGDGKAMLQRFSTSALDTSGESYCCNLANPLLYSLHHVSQPMTSLRKGG